MARSKVTVLAYHRIDRPDDKPLDAGLIDAYPDDFEAQMRFLASRYNVVSSWDLVRALREDYTLPARSLVITFDDGYRCFRDTAFPVLQRRGLPVTLFVPTGYPSQPHTLYWWDAIYRALALTERQEFTLPDGMPAPGEQAEVLPLRTKKERQAAHTRLVSALERLDAEQADRVVGQVVEQCAVEPNCTPYLLGWEDLRELAAAGVAIGPHTRNHVILSRTTPERARAEVEWSWSDLRERLPNPLPVFCYPNGQRHAINRAAVSAVKQAGLAAAFTMVPGLNVLGQTNPYLLRRVGAVQGESLARFRLKITLAGRVYRRLKALVRSASAPPGH